MKRYWNIIIQIIYYYDSNCHDLLMHLKVDWQMLPSGPTKHYLNWLKILIFTSLIIFYLFLLMKFAEMS